MELLKVYISLLTETSAQACVANFGKELFGQELGGSEPNTGIENKYIRAIDDFTDTYYGEDIKPDFISAIKNLKGCVNAYPEVLTPESTKIYRGLTIPIHEFIKGKTQINLKEPFNYLYKTPYKIQSWSTSFDIASSFGSNEVLNEIAGQIDFSNYITPEKRKELLNHLTKEGLTIAFVMEYHTNPNEFIFKSKYFKLLSANEHEDEILRIDNKPINVKIKFNDHQDVFLSMSGLKLIKFINLAISEL